MPPVTVATGLRGEAKMVGEPTPTRRGRSARATVDVLGTPRLIALCEEASCRAIEPRARRRAPPPSACGARSTTCSRRRSASEVVAEAVLAKVDGRRLTFTVSASDERGLVAAGKVIRVIVDVERFMRRCAGD